MARTRGSIGMNKWGPKSGIQNAKSHRTKKRILITFFIITSLGFPGFPEFLAHLISSSTHFILSKSVNHKYISLLSSRSQSLRSVYHQLCWGEQWIKFWFFCYCSTTPTDKKNSVQLEIETIRDACPLHLSTNVESFSWICQGEPTSWDGWERCQMSLENLQSRLPWKSKPLWLEHHQKVSIWQMSNVKVWINWQIQGVLPL